jgi:hypothetical protein
LRTIATSKSTMQSRLDETMVLSIKWGMEEKWTLSSSLKGALEGFKSLVILLWQVDNKLSHVPIEIHVSANQTPLQSAWQISGHIEVESVLKRVANCCLLNDSDFTKFRISLSNYHTYTELFSSGISLSWNITLYVH